MILAKQHLMAKHKWRFRLLNSEIGNDLTFTMKQKNNIRRFRLLNSEIGNDQERTTKRKFARIGFRLLNSEIGNDH